MITVLGAGPGYHPAVARRTRRHIDWSIQGIPVDDGPPSDGDTMVYREASRFFEFESPGGGGSLSLPISLTHADGGQFAVSSKGAFASGGIDGTHGAITASGIGSHAEGYVYDHGESGLIEATHAASFAQGYVYDLGFIRSTGQGSFAQGYAQGDGIGAEAQIISSAHGSFAQGYVYRLGTIHASASGSFAQGYVDGGGGAILASANGSFAQGYTYHNGTIHASGSGAFAQGYADASSVGTTSLILASGDGSFAQGYAYNNATIQATNSGAFAQGYINNGTGGAITASGLGSFARGYSSGGKNITASGNGSFAHGDASAADIIASASNAAQFGPGTNAVANSLRVGTGIRLFGVPGANGTPADGDIWVEGGEIKFRTNGVTKSASAI